MSYDCLEDEIKALIRTRGPIPVSAFMDMALSHPKFGYYATRDPLGAEGDFITAPEVSQMFGELIGLWVVQVWIDMDAPDQIHLVELGPGRGTLMADAQRAIKQAAPKLWQNLGTHLVETSPTLTACQQQNLEGKTAHPVTWHTDSSGLPKEPAIFIANEFFDALPIQQFIRADDGWRQREVSLIDDELTFTHANERTTDTPPMVIPNQEPEGGSVLEHCPSAITMMETIADHIADHTGAALIIDYGHQGGFGDTLQAVRNHKFHPVLNDPGEADLTAHVNFSALAQAVGSAGAKTTSIQTQGIFLKALGIEARANSLCAQANDAQKKAVEQALNRLVHPQEMGHLFKVLACYGTDQPVPPGFDA